MREVSGIPVRIKRTVMKTIHFIAAGLLALLVSLPSPAFAVCPAVQADVQAPDGTACLLSSGKDIAKAGKKKGKHRDKKKRGDKNASAVASPVPQRLSPEQQRRYDYFYLEAARLKTLRKYDAAFAMIEHCLSIDSCAASALYEMAQFSVYLKQMPQAVSALERAVLYDPDNYWYAQALANLYLQQKQTEKVTALLEGMAGRFPDKLDPLYSLLELYNRAEDYDRVIDILDRLEVRTGKSEQLTMEKFRIYLRKEDNKRAFKEIKSLVAEYPMDLRYQVVLGDAYLQNGKDDEAYAIYRKVLAQEPDNAMAIYSLASYYQETGQQELYRQQMDTLLLNKKVPSETKLQVMRQVIAENERAGADSTQIIRLFDRIMAQDPDDAEIPMLYAQYLQAKNMTEESVPILEKILDIDPTNTAARITLLGQAVRNEDYEAVIRICEAGVEATPEVLEFYFYLAIAYNQAGRNADVISTCQLALGRAVGDSRKELVSDFYTIMGDACYAEGRDEDAFIAYESALTYNASNVGALNNYAYYLSLERRDLDKAEEMSYKTIKAEPGNATYLDTYAWILFEKGNYTEARIYIDDAMANGGEESADVVEHCGDIYFMTGDVDGALKRWKQARDMGSESSTLDEKISQKKYIPYDNKKENAENAAAGDGK